MALRELALQPRHHRHVRRCGGRNGLGRSVRTHADLPYQPRGSAARNVLLPLLRCSGRLLRLGLDHQRDPQLAAQVPLAGHRPGLQQPGRDRHAAWLLRPVPGERSRSGNHRSGYRHHPRRLHDVRGSGAKPTQTQAAVLVEDRSEPPRSAPHRATRDPDDRLRRHEHGRDIVPQRVRLRGLTRGTGDTAVRLDVLPAPLRDLRGRAGDRGVHRALRLGRSERLGGLQAHLRPRAPCHRRADHPHGRHAHRTLRACRHPLPRG